MRAFVHDDKIRGQIPIVTFIPTCRDLEFAQHNGVLPYAELRNMIRRAEFEFIDFGEHILKRLNGDSPQKLYGVCKAHFNAEEGYRWLAQIAAAHLKRVIAVA